MKNKTEKALDEFIDDSVEETINKRKQEVLNERTGLIERIDKQYITNDGRILLREQY